MSDPDSMTSPPPVPAAPDAIAPGSEPIVGAAGADGTASSTPAPADDGTPAIAAAAPPDTATPAIRPATAGPRTTSESGRARPVAAFAARFRRPALVAGLALGAVGLGVAADRLALRSMGASGSRLDTALIEIRQSQEEIERLRGEMHGLRNAFDGSRQARTDLAAKQAQLADRVERGTQEATARLGKLGEQLDRMEKTGRDPGRLAGLVERLDKLEKGGAAPAAVPIPVAAARPAPGRRPDVTATGSLPAGQSPAAGNAPDGKPADPRKVQLDGYILRDVDGSHALVEARNGRLIEVTRGTTLPGIGRVEAVERRGRHWVVVTPKGYIGETRPARSF